MEYWTQIRDVIATELIERTEAILAIEKRASDSGKPVDPNDYAVIFARAAGVDGELIQRITEGLQVLQSEILSLHERLEALGG